MQTARILQAVLLMMVVALSASCAASKEYTTKLFGPRPEAAKDTQSVVRFLELEKLDPNKEDWVEVNITRDSTGTATSDPVAEAKTSPAPAPQEPIAKTTTRPDGTRNKTKRD